MTAEEFNQMSDEIVAILDKYGLKLDSGTADFVDGIKISLEICNKPENT